MGKSLIIKGANFYDNRVPPIITWYVDEYDQAVAQGRTIATPANPAYAGFTPAYDFGGKTINILKMKIAQAGKITLWVGNSRSDTNPTKVAELTFTSADVGQVKTVDFDDIIVPAGKALWIGAASDTGYFAYNNEQTPPGSSFGDFWVLCGTANARQLEDHYQILCVNWGYVE